MKAQEHMERRIQAVLSLKTSITSNRVLLLGWDGNEVTHLGDCWDGMKSVQFSLQSCVGIFDQITDQSPWNWGEFHHWRGGRRSVWAGFDTSADAVYSVNSLSCSGRGTLWEIMHTKNSSLEVQPEGFPVIWIPMQKYSTWRKHMEEKQLFENLNSIN